MSAKIFVVRLSVVWSVIAALWGLLVGVMPKSSIIDRFYLAAIATELFWAEIIAAIILLTSAAGFYCFWPAIQKLPIVQTLLVGHSNLSRSNRRWRQTSRVVVILCIVTQLVLLLSLVGPWLRFTYVFIRDDGLNAYLRRRVLLDATSKETGGKFDEAVSSYERFSRIFPDRAEANRIDARIKQIKDVTSLSENFYSQAIFIRSQLGVTREALRLSEIALSLNPRQAKYRSLYNEFIATAKTYRSSVDEVLKSCATGAVADRRAAAAMLIFAGYPRGDAIEKTKPIVKDTLAWCAIAQNGNWEKVQESWQLDASRYLLEAATGAALQIRESSFFSSSIGAVGEHDYYSSYRKNWIPYIFYRNTMKLWAAINPPAAIDSLTAPESDASSESFESGAVQFYPAILGETLRAFDSTRVGEFSASDDLVAAAKDLKIFLTENRGILFCWAATTRLESFAIKGAAYGDVAVTSSLCPRAMKEDAEFNFRTREQLNLLAGAIINIAKRTSSIRDVPGNSFSPRVRSLCAVAINLIRRGATIDEEEKNACLPEIQIFQLVRP